MKLIEWLNKLGILRWGGTAGVYRNAVERPLELQDPGVFNARRDLVGGDRAADAAKRAAPAETEPANCERRKNCGPT